jgi:hypothetical protein
MLGAVHRSLPVAVRYRHLSSRGLCLTDHVLSQLSPSPQSVASVAVCYLSCHVFAIADCCFSQPSSSPHPAVAPYGCATVSAECAVPGVVSGLRVVGVWLTDCLGLGWLLAFVVVYMLYLLENFP